MRVFDKIAEGRISRSAVRDVLSGLAQAGGKDETDAVLKRYSSSVSEKEVNDTVARVLEKVTLDFNGRPDARFRYVMGRAMAELGGRADGALVREAVSALIGRP